MVLLDHEIPEKKSKRQGQWYSIRPFTIENADPLALVSQTDDFIFVAHKGETSISLYMKALSLPSATRYYEARALGEQTKKTLPHVYKRNFEFKTTGVYPVAANEVARDKLLYVLRQDSVKDLTVIVSAKHTRKYPPLEYEMLRVARADRMANSPMEDKYNAKRRDLAAKSARPLYMCKIYVSFKDKQNAYMVRDILPYLHGRFRLANSHVDAAKVNKELMRPLTPYAATQSMGSSIRNSFDMWLYKRPRAREMVLSDIELAHLVQLPQWATTFPIPKGRPPTFVDSSDSEIDGEGDAGTPGAGSL